jgi:hypothetical protein
MTKMTISALIAIFAGAGILATTGLTVTNGFTVTNPAMAQNVTENATMAGNMTGGNMTVGNMTEAFGQISGGGRCGGTCYTNIVDGTSIGLV